MGRGLTYVSAAAVALFILAPIYLITVLAFSPREVVQQSFPKPIIPTEVSADTVTFFLGATGVWDSVLQSVIVAVLTLLFALAIGAPAGYALARYVFPGADTYRLAILATRAFPIVILAVPLIVTYIRWGLDDTALGVALLHTAMALPTTILVTSAIFVGVSQDLEAAAMTLGCSRFGACWKPGRPR